MTDGAEVTVIPADEFSTNPEDLLEEKQERLELRPYPIKLHWANPTVQLMNGPYIAYLDRIVDGEMAVLLLEKDGKTVDQLNVDVNELPKEGQHERAVFEVEVLDGELVKTAYWKEEEKGDSRPLESGMNEQENG